jgi:large subunit ribosomal protein L10
VTLNLNQKREIVSEVKKAADSAVLGVVAEYSGLGVSELNELRKGAREEQIFLRVIRNTLAKRALSETSFACLSDSLKGPVLIAFAQDEPKTVAALMRDFRKKNDRLVVTALALANQLFSGEALEQFAKLPSRKEALTILVSVIQAPVQKFVRTLVEPYAKLTRVVAAIANQKKSA